MSEDKQQTSIQKYKTIARAIVANDAPACYEIYEEFKKQGKELSDEDVNTLGLRWFNFKGEPSIEIADFLNDIGFNFTQRVILDPKNENTGTPIPFRLMGDDTHQSVLLGLLDRGYIPLDTSDGMGDNLIVGALELSQVDLADKLLAMGVELNNTNIAGQTGLHVCAYNLNFTAVKWLCDNKIDPTIEDLLGSVAAEMVPEEMSGWDANCMYEDLERYYGDFKNGKPFQTSSEYESMVELENKVEGEEDDQTLGEQADEAKALLSGLGM